MAATVDMSWQVALGVDAYARPFAQSTLQQFRAQLILYEKIRAVFQRSLELARERGAAPGGLLWPPENCFQLFMTATANNLTNILAAT